MKSRFTRIFAAALLFSFALGFGFSSAARGQGLTGQLGAHDPSTLFKDGNTYYYFCTGQGIVSRTSTNLTSWHSGQSVFSTAPAWTSTAVPGFTGDFWAPDVSFFNGLYHLYYSVSTFGSQVSAIGMATSPTLNPASPQYHWTDQGEIIGSTVGSAYNTIDPSICPGPNGTLWMSFGSYWNGVYQVQLDPTTGKVLNPQTPAKHLASNSMIEASYLYHQNNYYYLFLNWGMCCNGINSTYNIRMGRSTSINGPFLDESGVDMASGGGSLFLGTQGNYIGPGQIGIFAQNGQDYFSFHYYDGANNGSPTYDLRTLSWTADGWPSAVSVPEPAASLGVVASLMLGFSRRWRKMRSPAGRLIMLRRSAPVLAPRAPAMPSSRFSALF